MMDAISLWLGERLLIGSIQGAVIIALVWLTCRLFPRIPAAAQAALWWLAALKLVLALTPLPAVPVPILPADFHVQAQRPFLLPATPAAEELGAPLWIGDSATVRGQDDWFVARATSPWFRALLLTWFVALLVQASRLVLAHRHLRGVVRRSLAWTDDETGVLAARLGLTRTPEVRLSCEINSPQVFGLRSPVILIPSDTMAELSDEERTMTLCHELMHIRRRDLVLGWVPACAERLFFFHPLARLSAREYVSAREAACDAAAVRALGVSAGDYGRMLVRLGIGNVSPIIAAGGGAFSKSSLTRRLHMLEHNRLSKLSRRWRWALVVLAAVLIPMQLVARTPDTPQVSGPSFDLYQMLVGVWNQVQGKQVVVTPSPGNKDRVVGKLVALEQSQGDEPQQAKEVLLRLELGEKLKVDELELRTAVEKAEQELREKEEEIRLQIEPEVGQDGEVKLKIAKILARAEQESADAAAQAKREMLRAQVEQLLAKLQQSREGADVSQAEEAKRRASLEALVRQLMQARAAIERANADQTKTEFFLQERLRALADQPDQSTQQLLQQLAARLEQLAAEQRQLAEELRRLQAQPQK